jgi:hypothetical protein
MQNEALLMFAGAAIGGVITTLVIYPRLRSLRRHFDDLADRAAQAGLDLAGEAKRHEQAIGRLNVGAAELRRISAKLERAKETLHAAAAQSTSAGAKKVIAEGLERVRCAGERDDLERQA